MTSMPTQGMSASNSGSAPSCGTALRMLAMCKRRLMTLLSFQTAALMRILIPLDGLSLQIERIVACVAAELVAAHQSPKTQAKFVKRVAKKLILACYLAWSSLDGACKNTEPMCLFRQTCENPGPLRNHASQTTFLAIWPLPLGWKLHRIS